MSTGELDYDDGYVNDYDNTSFDQTDVSSVSERDIDEVFNDSREHDHDHDGEDDEVHEEYLSYSSMVDVAVKSNGQMLATHNHLVEGVPVFAFSEGMVWIGDTKHGVHVRDVKNFEVKKQLQGTSNMRCMTIVESEVWVGYCNGDIKVFDKNNLDAPPREISNSSSRSSIDCIAYSNGIIWTGSADWELKARRQTNGATIRTLPDGHRDWIRSIIIAGPNLWSCGDDVIILWNAEDGEKRRVIELKSKTKRIKCSILCVVGSTVWGGCVDGNIRIWNMDGDYLRRFHAHRGAVTSLVCAGSHVWSGGLDSTVKIWERENLNLLETLTLKFVVLNMGMHGTQVYLGGRKIIQVRMTSGLLEYLRDNYQKLDHDYVKLLQVYKSLIDKYEAAEPEATREMLDQLKAEKEALETEFDNLQAEKEMAVARIKELEESSAQRERELEEMVRESRDKMIESEQIAAEHQTRAADQEATLADHQSIISNNQTIISSHEAAISKHLAALVEKEGLIEKQKEMIAEHEKRVEEHEKTLAEKEAKVAERERQITEHEALISNHEAKIKEHEDKLQQLDTEKERLQQEKDELQAKIDALQQQLEEANEHGEKSIQVNNKKDAQNQELLDKVAELEEAKAKLESEKAKLQQQEAVAGSVATRTSNELEKEKEKHAKLLESEKEKHARLVQDLKATVRQRDDAIQLHQKELQAVQSGMFQVQPVVSHTKRPFAEKCAEFVVFILCSCLILTVLLYLHLASYSHSYQQIWPN